MDEDQIMQLVALVNAHAWLPVSAIIVGAVVRLLKTDMANFYLAQYFGLPPIPKKYLPWLAIGLGFVSAILDAKVAGKPVSVALIEGIGSAFVAVTGHQVVVESIRDGKEPFGKKA